MYKNGLAFNSRSKRKMSIETYLDVITWEHAENSKPANERNQVVLQTCASWRAMFDPPEMVDYLGRACPEKTTNQGAKCDGI